MSPRRVAYRRGLPIVRLLVYLVAALSLGAVAAFPIHSALEPLAAPAFDSVLRRVTALALLLLLPAYLAFGEPAHDNRPALGLAARLAAAARRREPFGLDCTARAFRRGFLRGFALGILMVSPLVAAFLALGVRAHAPAAPSAFDAAGYLAYALVGAVLIGFIEEAYFRGALLTPLRPLPSWLAVSTVALVYAGVHFLGAQLPTGQPGWSSGLMSLGRSAVPLDAFLGLFAAGLFLGALRVRCGHIAVGAGFHAGWVLVMKLNQEYTDIVPGSEWAFVEGEFGGTMGYLGLAWIGLLGAAWYALEHRRAPRLPRRIRAAPPAGT